MTEDEAKTKWCPHVRMGYQGRLAGPVNRVTNSDGTEAAVGNCIGSACMAWRWLDDEPGCEAGFCGLAGRPHA